MLLKSNSCDDVDWECIFMLRPKTNGWIKTNRQSVSLYLILLVQGSNITHGSFYSLNEIFSLPTTYVVQGKVLFSQVSVILFRGRCVGGGGELVHHGLLICPPPRP